MSVRITVVIPSRNADLVSRCVKSIIRTHEHREDLGVVVVDDGLESRPIFSGLVTYVEGVKPFCYARNINIGISSTDPHSDVFLMNDDAYFISSGALTALRCASALDASFGILGPVFTRAERTRSQRLGQLDHDDGVWTEVKHLTFAAAYLTREVLNLVGPLDERYTGYGYEDNDYCLRAQLKGLKLGVLPSVVVGHGNEFGQASLTFRKEADMVTLSERNEELFIRKWSVDLLHLRAEQIEDLMQFLRIL